VVSFGLGLDGFEGQVLGAWWPGVRKKRMGEMKLSNVLSGELKRCVFSLWRWLAVHGLKGVLVDGWCERWDFGGREVAIGVQS
jgi:hypothetical protein